MRIIYKKAGEDLVVNSNDRIFLGDALVETIKVVAKHSLYSELHWQRLLQAANRLEISFKQTVVDWQNNLDACVNATGLYDGGIKVFLSAGSASRGLSQRGSNPCLILEAFEYQVNTSPVRLVSSPWLRDPANPVYQLKSVNYLEAILAQRWAETVNANDVLFFNIHQCATETTIANLFLVHNDKLYTPSINCGILGGVMRSQIITLAEQQGMVVLECALEREFLSKADALFICNALQGIRNVSVFDGLLINTENVLVEKLKALIT